MMRSAAALLLATAGVASAEPAACPWESLVSWGNSYAVDHTPALEAATDCPVTEIAAPGKLIDCDDWCNAVPTMLDTLDSDLDVLAALPGPVGVVLQAGHGDEVLDVAGLSPADVADHAAILVDAILSERPDVHVWLLTGDEELSLPPAIGTEPVGCDFTYHGLLAGFDPRFHVADLTRLSGSPDLFRDSCHVNALGAEIRTEEWLVTVPELNGVAAGVLAIFTLYLLRKRQGGE